LTIKFTLDTEYVRVDSLLRTAAHSPCPFQGRRANHGLWYIAHQYSVFKDQFRKLAHSRDQPSANASPAGIIPEEKD
jgi:hypothetical protein